MIDKIGVFSAEVIEILNLDIAVGTEILVGITNREHMKKSHLRDFKKYYDKIDKIISEPDYVGINKSDNSIEFIKTFGSDVKVAVRVANDGEYYARSLYEVGKSRVKNSVKKGQLKSLTKS